jgi:hypothetical protein
MAHRLVKDLEIVDLILQEAGRDTSGLIDYISPYEFVFNYCYTTDPHDPLNPVKNIPDIPYIRGLIDLWLTEHSLLVVKSRQMMVTWLFCALNLWLAMTHAGQYIFFISKKEDDAGFSTSLSLLSRAFFIYDHLPKELKIPYSRSGTPSLLTFTSKNSTIHGVSQDSDAVRQYTASSIFFDEMAFMERAEQCFASIKPTLDGYKTKLKLKGENQDNLFITLPKFAGVSTPNGKRNLFAKLVFDKQE